MSERSNRRCLESRDKLSRPEHQALNRMFSRHLRRLQRRRRSDEQAMSAVGWGGSVMGLRDLEGVDGWGLELRFRGGRMCCGGEAGATALGTVCCHLGTQERRCETLQLSCGLREILALKKALVAVTGRIQECPLTDLTKIIGNSTLEALFYCHVDLPRHRSPSSSLTFT